MVKFSVFPSSQKKGSPQKSIEAYKEIAFRMLSSGKSEAEVAAYLKSQGLPYESIDKIITSIIKTATTSEKDNDFVTLPKPLPQPSPQPSLPKIQPRIPQNFNQNTDISSILDKLLEKIVVEIEEIVDLVIEKKYGNLKKDLKELKNLKQNIEEIENNINSKVEEIKEDIEKKVEEINKNLEEINKKIEDLEPKINALENAFKDNIPNIIDDLRKIEKIVENRYEGEDKPVLSMRKQEETTEEKDMEEEKEEELPEFKINDLIG